MNFTKKNAYVKEFWQARTGMTQDQWLAHVKQNPIQGEALYYQHSLLNDSYGADAYLFAGYENSLSYWDAVAESGRTISNDR